MNISSFFLPFFFSSMQKIDFFGVCFIFYALLMYSRCLMHRNLFSLAGGSVFTVTSALAGTSMAQYIFWQKKNAEFCEDKDRFHKSGSNSSLLCQDPHASLQSGHAFCPQLQASQQRAAQRSLWCFIAIC